MWKEPGKHALFVYTCLGNFVLTRKRWGPPDMIWRHQVPTKKQVLFRRVPETARLRADRELAREAVQQCGDSQVSLESLICPKPIGIPDDCHGHALSSTLKIKRVKHMWCSTAWMAPQGVKLSVPKHLGTTWIVRALLQGSFPYRLEGGGGSFLEEASSLSCVLLVVAYL